MLRLKRPLNRHAYVVGLLLRKLSQLRPHLAPGEASRLPRRVSCPAGIRRPRAVRPEIDLGEGLVGEAVGHHEAGMAGRAAEVDQAAFGQQVDGVAVGECVRVHLGLDVGVLDARPGLERVHLDLVVEMADVADDGLVLHFGHVLRR